LSTIPAIQTTWKEWKKTHPDTRVLKKESNIWRSTYERYFKDPDRIGLFRTFYLKEQLPGKSKIFGITSGPHALAVDERIFDKDDLIHAAIDTMQIIIIRTEDNGVRAYKNQFGKFEQSDSGEFYRDARTASVWDFNSGKCINGILKNKYLEEITVLHAYWFAWSVFYPNTMLIK